MTVLVATYDDRPLDVEAELERRGEIWARVAGAHDWLEVGDLVAIARARGVSIGVRATKVLRRHRLVELDGARWRALARSPLLFRRALAAAFAFAGVVDHARAPDETSFYDDPDVLAASARVIDEGLWPVEERIVERWLPPGARILDVGCGTGREALSFARRGLRVHAIDPASRAIGIARRAARDRALDVSFEAVSLEDFVPRDGPFDAVFFASDVIGSSRARAALLLRARDLVKQDGIVVYQREIGMRRVTRAAFAALHAAGIRRCEPGDTMSWYGAPPVLVLRNVLPNERAVVVEAQRAGLVWEARVGSYVAARRETAHAFADPFSVEVARTLRVFPSVERARRAFGPKEAAAAARSLSHGAPRRDALGRAQLREAIALCDRMVPTGGGCYRRVLLEAALDAGAAEEAIHLGLRRDERRGHAWLERDAPAETYDITTTL